MYVGHMTNARGKDVDNTQLEPTHDTAHGLIHRDRFAHLNRFWIAARKAVQLSRELDRPVRILDLGAGSTPNLAEVLWRNMYSSYVELLVTVDMKSQVEQAPCGRALQPAQDKMHQWHHIGRIDELPDGTLAEWQPDLVTCFEVFEHVQPAAGLAILERIRRCTEAGAVALLSTPVWNYPKPAAGNHVSEARYEPLNHVLAQAFTVRAATGMFARIAQESAHLCEEAQQIYAELRPYVSTEILSVALAPLLPPSRASNCMWELEKQDDDRVRNTYAQFEQHMLEYDAPWTSSPHWRDLLPPPGHALLAARDPLW